MGHFDIMIIGGGAAGIAAARAAADAGCKSIALVERKQKLGGILLQCSIPVLAPDLPEGNTPLRLCRISRKRLLCFWGQRCFR